MRTLVTGGNGHLGFNLVRALLARGYGVRSTVRSLADANKTAPLRTLGNVELVEADVRDETGMRAALQGIGTLFHVAAVYSTAEPERSSEVMGEFRLGAPNGNFSFVDVRDAAEAHVLAAERDARGRFIIGYDLIPSFDRLVRILGTIDKGVKPPLMVLPTFLAPTLPLYDLFSHHVFGTPRISTPEVIAAAVSGKVWNFSCRRAKTELGWQPRIPFEQSLRETVQALRERPSPRRRQQ